MEICPKHGTGLVQLCIPCEAEWARKETYKEVRKELLWLLRHRKKKDEVIEDLGNWLKAGIKGRKLIHIGIGFQMKYGQPIKKFKVR